MVPELHAGCRVKSALIVANASTLNTRRWRLDFPVLMASNAMPGKPSQKANMGPLCFMDVVVCGGRAVVPTLMVREVALLPGVTDVGFAAQVTPVAAAGTLHVMVIALP